MTLIERLFVRGALAVGTVGAAAMLALAPQPGVATTFALDDHSGKPAMVRNAEPAPSAACVAARSALVAAFKADVTEDATERNLVKSGADSADPTEDQTEKANIKPLITAMVTACEANEPAEHPKPTTPPTAACTAAKNALKQYFTQLSATEKSDWTSGSEGTPADQSQDQGAWTQAKTLFQAVAAACGFPKEGDDSDWHK